MSKEDPSKSESLEMPNTQCFESLQVDDVGDFHDFPEGVWGKLVSSTEHATPCSIDPCRFFSNGSSSLSSL